MVIQPLGKVSLIVAWVACCYAASFGICEVLRIPLRPIGLQWQVPNQWLRGRPAAIQTLIWGICLGPGFITKNPYAGIWLLPFLLALTPSPFAALNLGVAIGVAHGCGRAIGILRNQKKLKTGTDCTPMMIFELWRWQFLDGFLLLVSAGGLSAYIISLLGRSI